MKTEDERTRSNCVIVRRYQLLTVLVIGSGSEWSTGEKILTGKTAELEVHVSV